MHQWLAPLALLVLGAFASPLAVQAQVKVDRGVYAGGDIRDSQIMIGIPHEQLPGLIEAATKPLHKRTAEQQAAIVELEGRLSVNQAQLLTFFQILGEENVAPERIGSKLVEIAQHYRDLLEQAAVATSDDPQVAALKEQVRLALAAPDLERADALLAEVQEIQDAAADRMALEAAATAAQRAGIALTRLRYGDAARLFSKAATRVPPDHDEERSDYLQRQADALYRQGDEKGDNPALREAIDLYRDLVADTSRRDQPLDWAMTQNNLGNALWTLGQRESGTARLEEAVGAFRDALQERTRERVPLDWAGTQNNLGNALSTLGERESGTARLEEAELAIQAAYAVYRDNGYSQYRAYFEERLTAIQQLIDERSP